MLTPVRFMNLIARTVNIVSRSLCHLIPSSSETWSSISPYLSLVSLPMNLYTRSHVIAFRDQITRLKASLMQCQDGHMYLSVTWIGKSWSWYLLLYASLWKTWVAPFWSPCYEMILDNHLNFFQNSDLHYLIVKGSGCEVLCVLSSMVNFVTRSH